MLGKHLKQFSPSSLFLILLGTLVWSLTMVKSGWSYAYGLGFWGANGHDGVWHIALAESLSRGSRGMPVFAGETLKNYHFGFDLLVALLHKITQIPVTNLYFQIIPPLLALFIGLLTYWFTLSWTNSKIAAFWATFFVYFGGSWGWVVTLFREGSLGGESMFWSQQSVSTLVNPPFALSLVFILLGLILLLKFLKANSTFYMLLATLFFGLLIQIKVYASVLVLGSLVVAGIFEVVRERRYNIIRVFLGTLIVSIILFLPFNKNPGSLLVWQPFWFLETMMGLTDRLGWLKFYSAMTNYRMGGMLIKAIPAYFIAFLVFWLGNLGSRVIKELLLIKWLKDIKRISWVEIFIASVILGGVLIPMFFLQKGTPWNTIQFMYYTLFFSSILAGVALSEWIQKSSVTAYYYTVTLVVLLTIPTAIGTLSDVYLPSRPPAMVSNEELAALKFLSDQPQGIVLAYPFDRIKAKEAEINPPRPLYLYESTAYVSALAKKPVFLEDEVNLDITGYDWKTRRSEAEKFYQSLEQNLVREFLSKNDIKYIYWLKSQRATLGEKQLGIERIFENEQVDIYRMVNQN